MRIQVMLTLPREAASVPLVRRTVSAALRSAGVATECVQDVEIALSEACTNVFNHADAGDDYEVVINLGSEQVSIDVLDAGSGFGQDAPTPSMPQPDAESGRGVALMAAFSDLAVFDSVAGNGGSVHLMKRLYRSDGAPMSRGQDNGAPQPRGAR